MQAMLLVALCFGCMGIYELVEFMLPQQIAQFASQSPEVFSVVQRLLIFVLPTIIYVNIFPLERFGYLRLSTPVSWLTVLIGAAALVLLIPAIELGVVYIEKSFTDPKLIEYIQSLKKSNVLPMPTVGSLFVCLLVNAFVPAFCEELFFRAGLQQILMQRSRDPIFPIIISALLFTIFHSNPAVMPFIFLSGLLLGYAFYRTGSLRMTIIMHFLFNGTELFLEFQAQRHLSVRLWTPGVLLTSVCVMGAALCIFLLWKRTRMGRMGV
jgi:membrane protease YdiL (CAAX protease family)